MRNVVFIGHSKEGSCKMRGIQTSQALHKYHGIEAPYLLKDQFLTNIDAIKNSIVIFVGEPLFLVNSSLENFMLLKKNNNILIYDVIDNFCFPQSNPVFNNKLVSMYEPLDLLIHTNIFSERKTETVLPSAAHITIPHQWDMDNENLPLPQSINTSKAAYIGGENGFQLSIDGLESYVDVHHNISEGNKQQSEYTLHTSFRSSDTLDYFYKPCTKLAVASSFGAILLTSREESVVDVVGRSYEFYIDNKEDLKNKVNLLKEMSMEQIKHYRDAMKAVKEYLSPQQTSNRYIEIFNSCI